MGHMPETIGRHRFHGMNVWSMVEMRARLSTDRTALIWAPFEATGHTWTFGELARDAAAVAAGLARRGVGPGDPVLIHMENCPEFVVSWYACAALGAIAVTTNTRSADDELRYFASHSEAVGVITQPKFAERLAKAAPEARFLVSTDHDAGVVPASVSATGDEAFASLLASDPDELAPAPLDVGDPMSVQYTSGTTSRPKAVLWTHANALWGASQSARNEGLTPADRYLCYLPLFHTNALSYTMLASMWVGSDYVLIPKWSTSRFWDISAEHRCTIVNLMGLSGRAIAQSTPPPTNTYRLFGAGACDLPWDEHLGVKSLGWWGMTETVTHPIVGDLHTPNRPWSMGRPAPEYEIAVVREDGSPVEPEETGRLLVRGVRGLSLFAEYLHDPEGTAASFDADGWFDTGDLVTPHVDGHISFSDRVKDMLKVGAENVAASEVEQVIATVPGVREASVVAKRDDTLDEVPVVFVVPDGTPGDGFPELIVETCRQKLADFKVPRHVYLVRDLPRSTLDKVHKVELRKVANEEISQADAEAAWLAARVEDPSGDAT